jgi:hypothetical protein
MAQRVTVQRLDHDPANITSGQQEEDVADGNAEPVGQQGPTTPQPSPAPQPTNQGRGTQNAAANPGNQQNNNSGQGQGGNGGGQPANPLVPPEPEKTVGKPINRYLTFLAGILFTILVYLMIEFVAGFWIDFNGWIRFVVGSIVFYLIFVLGLRDTYLRREKAYPPSDVRAQAEMAQGEKKIHARVWSVVLLFDAPLPHWIRFIIPPGWAWLPPGICKIRPQDMREQAYDIPPDPANLGFEITSISKVDVDRGPDQLGTKYVPMLVKVRIRWRVVDVYKWYAQDKATVERTLVSLVVETMRHIATNGNYPGERDMPITSDIDLMSRKQELGHALTEDARLITKKDWGISVIDVIVRQLKPKDKKLERRYLQIAQEVADREAQSLENAHIRQMAKKMMTDENIPASEAFLYAYLSAGKTTLENFKALGGPAVFFNRGGGTRPGSPSPS